MQYGEQIRTQGNVRLAEAGHRTGNRRTSCLDRSDVRLSSFAVPSFPLCKKGNDIVFCTDVLIGGRPTDCCWTSFFPLSDVKYTSVRRRTCHGTSTHLPWYVDAPTMVRQRTDHGGTVHRPWWNSPPTMVGQSTDHGVRAHRLWYASTPTMVCEHTDHGVLAYLPWWNSTPTMVEQSTDHGVRAHRPWWNSPRIGIK